jgi:hypothetical protein
MPCKNFCSLGYRYLTTKIVEMVCKKGGGKMQADQEQTQDDQTQLQNEYPANESSLHNEAQADASGDDTQTSQAPGWRPSEDPAIEQAGGITQTSEGEPGRSQQDGKAQGTGDDDSPPSREQSASTAF